MINKKILFWFILVVAFVTGMYWVANSQFAKPFFPVGLFGVDNTAVFSELKAAGFNCLVTYRKDQEFLERWTEEAEKAGLKVIMPPLFPHPKPSPLTPTLSPKGRGEDEAGEGVNIRRGSVLAWYLADEPDIHGIRPEDIIHPNPPLEKEGIKERIPTAICVGRGQAAALYRDVCDIIMVDWYPVPHLPLESVGEHVSEAVAAARPGQPVWAIIQAFPWSVFSNKAKFDESGKYNRPPTYEEMNKMVQFAINAGASGILFYTFQGNGWKITDDHAHWANVKKTARNINSSLSLGGIKGTGFPIKTFGNDDLWTYGNDPRFRHSGAGLIGNGNNGLMLWLKVMGTGLITTLLLIPLAKLLGRKFGLTDRPDGELKNHKVPIPHTGGLSIWIGVLAGIAVATAASGFGKITTGEWSNYKLMAIMLGSLILLIMGLVDDICADGLSPQVKISVEIVAGLIVAASGIQFNFAPWKLVNIIGTIVVIVAMCNAVNLLDGLDGLAGGVIAISSFFLFIMAISQRQAIAAALCLALLGACLGFLAYNLPPANVFMGNSGSLTLGFGTAATAILITQTQGNVKHALMPFIVLGVPITEATITIVRRMIKGQPVFTGDRNHVYDLLTETKLGRTGTMFAFFGVTIGLSILAITLGHY